MNPMPLMSFSRASKAVLYALIVSSCDLVCATAGSIGLTMNLPASKVLDKSDNLSNTKDVAGS